MNKKSLWIIALLILMAAGVVTFSFWPKTKLPEIKIVDNTILSYISAEKGFFKEEGFQVDVETISSEDRISALLAGEIDYAIFYGLLTKPIIEASLRNAPIKTIMFTKKHQVYFLVVQPELELNNLKTIAITSRHTSLHYQVLKFIEKNNLKIAIMAPETQKGLWTAEKLQSLLLAGEVDAILTYSIYSTLQLQTQGFPILDTLIDESPSDLNARNDKIEKKPEEVQKVVRTLERTMEFIVTRPEETKKLLLKFWDLEKTEENLAMVEKYYPLLKTAYDRKNIPPDEGAELLIQIVKAEEFETLQEVEEQIVTPQDLQKVFDFRFVK